MYTHGTNDGETERREQAMLKNRKSTKKKDPRRPTTGKEWLKGYREWLKENKRIILKELKKNG